MRSLEWGKNFAGRPNSCYSTLGVRITVEHLRLTDICKAHLKECFSLEILHWTLFVGFFLLELNSKLGLSIFNYNLSNPLFKETLIGENLTMECVRGKKSSEKLKELLGEFLLKFDVK